MIRLVAFDFDGTLVDSNAIKERTFQDVVASLTGGTEALVAARLKGGDRYRIFEEVSRVLEPDGDCQPVLARRLADDYARRCLRAIGAAPERRGASRVLRHLWNRGIKVYLNTATPDVDVPALLRKRGWASLFKGIYGSSSTKSENLRMILGRERVAPSNALMVGDSLDDSAAAAEMGTWFVGITAECRIAVEPPFAMQDLIKLPALLARLGS